MTRHWQKQIVRLIPLLLGWLSIFASQNMLFALIMSVIFSACGTSRSHTPPPNNKTLEIKVGFHLSSGDETSSSNLGLTVAPTSFVIAVSGCQSGVSFVYDSAQLVAGESINLYKFDRGCVAALRSFVLDGKTYTEVNGSDFSGTGTAEFKNNTTTIRYGVTNPTTLPSPLTEGAQVSFSLYQSNEKTSLDVPVSYSAAVGIASASGYAAPQLKWYGGATPLTLVADQINKQHLRFKLECTAATWTTGDPLTNSTCDNGSQIDTMNEYHVILTTDTSTNTLSASAARTLFGYSGSELSTDTASPSGTNMVSIVSNAQVFTPNGGLSGGITADVVMPTSCLNYFLVVLRKPTGSNLVKDWSFTYFNIDWGAAGQSCGG